MALKPDRNYTNAVDISYFMNHTAERGGIVVFDTSGSGAAMDQAAALVRGSGTRSSGTVPVGVLLNDVVNLDLTRQHINWHKDEVQVNGKVAILRRGVITTNVIDSADNPVAGNIAYYAAQTFGNDTNKFVFSVDNDAIGISGSEPLRVGRFLSSEDEDGYAKIEVNLP